MANPGSFGSRGSTTGPHTGGLLLYNLCQKRAGQAAARSEDTQYVMTKSYLVAAIVSTPVAAPTLMWVDAQDQQQNSGLTGGGRFIIRKDTVGVGGEGAILVGDVGWVQTDAIVGLRSLSRCGAGGLSSATTARLNVDVDDNGTATAAFNNQFLCLVACKGHRYDADDTFTGKGAGATATSKTGYPYDSLKDSTT